jgi:hypothetical protein|tara:strand:- start:33200 stop:33337 length:138 start_codon:yes stop_codon:yes gene_type:complete
MGSSAARVDAPHRATPRLDAASERERARARTLDVSTRDARRSTRA